jgi:glyoxylase I family protein
LHHCGLLVRDVQQSLHFYLNILSMEDISYLRPKTLPYPGAFVQCGKSQLHLMQLANPDDSSIRPEYVGRDRHIAISVKSVRAVQSILEKHQIPYKLSSSGRAAIFFRDFDGNGFEFTEDSIS